MCRSDVGDCNLVLSIAIGHLSWVEYGKCYQHYPPNGDGYLLWFWVHRDHIYAYSSIFGNPEFSQGTTVVYHLFIMLHIFLNSISAKFSLIRGNFIFSSLIACLRYDLSSLLCPRSLYLCNRWSNRQCEPGDISFSPEGPDNLFFQCIFFNTNPCS